MTTQECFDNACNYYTKSLDLIEEMGELANRHLTDRSYDIKIMKKQFDILLQTLLLKVACADNIISSVETKFIDKITDYVDILIQLELSFTNGRPITWNNLQTLNPQNYEGLCRTADEWAEEYVRDLISVLIFADRHSEFDYLHAFTKSISFIVRCLCEADGEYTSSERESISEIICDKYYTAWYSILNRYNNEHNDKSSESNNSLKSQYHLKKNI